MGNYSKTLKALKPKLAVQETAEGKPSRGGKRSNPEYSPSTFFLRKATRNKANKLLIDGVAGDMDLSDLIESLLLEWIAKHPDA